MEGNVIYLFSESCNYFPMRFLFIFKCFQAITQSLENANRMKEKEKMRIKKNLFTKTKITIDNILCCFFFRYQFEYAYARVIIDIAASTLYLQCNSILGIALLFYENILFTSYMIFHVINAIISVTIALLLPFRSIPDYALV
jgi:hypothetical protein